MSRTWTETPEPLTLDCSSSQLCPKYGPNPKKTIDGMAAGMLCPLGSLDYPDILGSNPGSIHEDLVQGVKEQDYLQNDLL